MLQENFTRLDTALHQDYSLSLPVDDAQEIIKGAVYGLSSSEKKLLIDSGLWPTDKPMTLEKWDERLEKLWYQLFYKGKNADLYLIPDTSPIEVLMVRSDRTSVFNIKLDLEIEWKGEIQTQISKFGAQFVEDRWFPTCFTNLPDNIPESLRNRCQSMELCKPLTMEIDGEEKWLELIFRNYSTWSFHELYSEWKDPYELDISEWMKQWDKFENPIFTPTTKDSDDTPIASHLVRRKFPDIINKLEALFAEFTAYMYDRWYIVIDTKVEVFMSGGFAKLWDEIFTPESSRFIKIEDFEAGNYISADKQIIRNLGEEFWWKDRLEEILKLNHKAEKKLAVSDEVSSRKRQELLDGYSDIYSAMQK